MSERNMTDVVKERYGAIARGTKGGCCGAEEAVARAVGYDPADLATIPAGANLGVGCGAPIGFLELRSGETVLDLGSGAGIDCLLAARAVGSAGRVIGVDMTVEMLERARSLATGAGVDTVEFREGRLEALPVEDASVDAVTSNCVINLVPDKDAVFREIARVLRPGGRLVISDIVLDRDLPGSVRDSVMAYVGCVAGAMRRGPYFEALARAGLTSIEILRDVDYLAATGAQSIPEKLRSDLAALGIGIDDLDGVVHSVTYRAIREP
jgi:SAM-dependent methyltransferase